MGELDRRETTIPDDALVGETEGLGPKRPPEAKDVGPSAVLLGNRQSLRYFGEGMPSGKLWMLWDCRFVQPKQQTVGI